MKKDYYIKFTAIKNISDSDNRVYARRYIYKGYDLCITSDRVLPYILQKN